MKKYPIKRLLGWGVRLLIYSGIGAAAVVTATRLYTEITARQAIYPVETVPQAPVAIVFGAGLRRDGTPQPVLQDRVAAAVDLYKAGKVKKLLMTGDNRFVDYNEPGAMGEYAISLGVPAEDIVLDYAGRRTYDSCYRARDIFGVSQAILVTQRFHLPRALYLCRSMGLSVTGVSADRREYRKSSLFSWNVRELAATLVAVLEINLTHPLPVLGSLEPIFPAAVK